MHWLRDGHELNENNRAKLITYLSAFFNCFVTVSLISTQGSQKRDILLGRIVIFQCLQFFMSYKKQWKENALKRHLSHRNVKTLK